MQPTFIGGRPALFLTSAERAWRETVGAVHLEALRHPRLAFTVASFRRGGQDFDIDNLTKPVLELVAPAPETVWVTVAVGEKEGVLIAEEEPPPPARADVALEVARPRRRSVRPLVPLGETSGMRAIEPLDAVVGLELAFDSQDEPIGDFGFNGPIKPLIDALGNVLGTYAAGPRDYRVKELRVRRGARPGSTGAQVKLWRL